MNSVDGNWETWLVGASSRERLQWLTIRLRTCEGCDRHFEGHTKDYADLLTQAKAEGWEMRRVSGQWVHLCPWCASPGND
jgi:hypothetical protein